MVEGQDLGILMPAISSGESKVPQNAILRHVSSYVGIVTSVGRSKEMLISKQGCSYTNWMNAILKQDSSGRDMRMLSKMGIICEAFKPGQIVGITCKRPRVVEKSSRKSKRKQCVHTSSHEAEKAVKTVGAVCKTCGHT